MINYSEILKPTRNGFAPSHIAAFILK